MTNYPKNLLIQLCDRKQTLKTNTTGFQNLPKATGINTRQCWHMISKNSMDRESKSRTMSMNHDHGLSTKV